MSKKLTQIEVEQRFKDRNLVLLDTYKDNNIKVKIQCYCGKSFQTVPSKIFNSHTSSCGCYLHIFQNYKLKDLTGQRFYKLLVKSRSSFKLTKHGNVKYWNCLCDCGKTCIVSQGNLGRSIKSCGCNKLGLVEKADKKIKVGDKFYKLTVIKLAFDNTKKYYEKRRYRCLCECGQYTTVVQSALLFGGTKSCGNCLLYRNGKKISFIQLDLYKMINRGVINFKTGKYFIDIAFVNNGKKIAVEYDSWYYHKKRIVNDEIRTKYLIKNGWSVLSIKSNSKLPNAYDLNLALKKISNYDCNYHEIILSDWK